jgi:hypothetical protein
VPISASNFFDLAGQLTQALGKGSPGLKITGSNLNPKRTDIASPADSDTGLLPTAPFAQKFLLAIADLQTQVPPATTPKKLIPNEATTSDVVIRHAADGVMVGMPGISGRPQVVLSEIHGEIEAIASLISGQTKPPAAENEPGAAKIDGPVRAVIKPKHSDLSDITNSGNNQQTITALLIPPALVATPAPTEAPLIPKQNGNPDLKPMLTAVATALVSSDPIAQVRLNNPTDTTSTRPEPVRIRDNIVFEGQLRLNQVPLNTVNVSTEKTPDEAQNASRTVRQDAIVPTQAPQGALKTTAGLLADQTSPVTNNISTENRQSTLFGSFGGGAQDARSDRKSTNVERPTAILPVVAQSVSDSRDPIAQKTNIPSSKTPDLPMDPQMTAPQASVKSDLNVRLQGQSGENISVRISERGGEIQVSIRSTDQATANTLRHEMPGIQAGLEHTGWRLENASGTGGDLSRHESSGDSRQQEQNSDGRGQHPDWQDRREQRRNSPADQWFDLNQ